MAQFNLNDYDLVETRIKKFYADFPDGRIITENLTTPQDRAAATWIVRATLYLSGEEQLHGLPKSTGLAFEVDGTGGANKTSALENAETSAIGRALANADYSGNKRSSRSEMAKVESGVTPVGRNWLVEAEQMSLVYDVDGLLKLYAEAQAAKAPEDTLTAIRDYGVAARG